MTDAKHRDRVSLSITPRLATILDRHAHPGEPRAATAARLIEQADTLTSAAPPEGQSRFLLYPRVAGHSVTSEMVADALDE